MGEGGSKVKINFVKGGRSGEAKIIVSFIEKLLFSIFFKAISL